MRAATQIPFKILRRRACKHIRIVKHTANVPAAHCKKYARTKQRAKQLCCAVHNPSVFGVRLSTRTGNQPL